MRRGIKSVDILEISVILTITFIIIRITGLVTWSVWWVFLPLLIGVGGLFLVGLILVLYYVFLGKDNDPD